MDQLKRRHQRRTALASTSILLTVLLTGLVMWSWDHPVWLDMGVFRARLGRMQAMPRRYAPWRSLYQGKFGTFAIPIPSDRRGDAYGLIWSW